MIEEVNTLFADQELYISHFFEESQVILIGKPAARPRDSQSLTVMGVQASGCAGAQGMI